MQKTPPMYNDAKERTKWKVKWVDWVNQLPPLIKHPTQKLIAEVTLGILNSGSLQLCDIDPPLSETPYWLAMNAGLSGKK